MPCIKKKVYRDKKGVGSQVSSQEQRALLVLVINRLSAGCQSVVVFLHRFTWVSVVRASGETFRRRLSNVLEGTTDGRLLGEPSCRRLVLLAPPRRLNARLDPTRPRCIRVLESSSFLFDANNEASVSLLLNG